MSGVYDTEGADIALAFWVQHLLISSLDYLHHKYLININTVQRTGICAIIYEKQTGTETMSMLLVNQSGG